MVPKTDYSRSDDYDPEGAEWMSHTIIGSVYEEEIDIRSRTPNFRHRNFFDKGPWKKGPAPDRKAAH